MLESSIRIMAFPISFHISIIFYFMLFQTLLLYA